jgi:hypothetical protein
MSMEMSLRAAKVAIIRCALDKALLDDLIEKVNK